MVALTVVANIDRPKITEMSFVIRFEYHVWVSIASDGWPLLARNEGVHAVSNFKRHTCP